MKKLKILSSIGIVAIMLTFLFNSVSVNNSDLDLAELVSLNIANAEGSAKLECKDVENSGSGYFYLRRCDGCCWDYMNWTANGGFCSGE